MAYTTSKATIGRSTQVFLGGVTGTSGAGTFQLIGELDSASLSEMQVDFEDATNFESGAYKEWVATLIDSGTVDIKGNYIAGGSDPGQAALQAALGSLNPYDVRLVLPLVAVLNQTTSGDVFEFSAFVSRGGGLEISVGKKIQLSAQLKITGPRNFVAGS